MSRLRWMYGIDIVFNRISRRWFTALRGVKENSNSRWGSKQTRNWKKWTDAALRRRPPRVETCRRHVSKRPRVRIPDDFHYQRSTKRMIPAGFYTKSITLFFCFFPRNLSYELPVRELLKDYFTCSGIRSYEIESSSKLILYIGSPFSLAISDRIFS